MRWFLLAFLFGFLVLAKPLVAQKQTPNPTSSPKQTSVPVSLALPKGIDGFEGHLKVDWAKVPRDRAGRPLGFGNLPLINYSPTMVTGKPCPRVQRWGVRAIDPSNAAFRKVDNPCVLQNLIDDIAPALWFFPSGWDSDTYQKVVRPLVQRRDSLFQDGVSWVDSNSKGVSIAQRWRNWSYFVCDKPVYLLVDISPDQLLDQRGNLRGDFFQVWFFMTTADFSSFTCRAYRHRDGRLHYEYKMTEAQMNGSPPSWVTIPYSVRYLDGRWRIAARESNVPYSVTSSYRAIVQKLMPEGYRQVGR
jgi:hypothetical protein